MKTFFNSSRALRAAVVFAGLVVVASSSVVGNAGTIHSFGPLAGATFGGSGIASNPVAISTITDGRKTITLGLAATQRFDANAGITGVAGSNNSGIYYANAGVYDGLPQSGTNESNFARWSFSYYIGVEGGKASDYLYRLYYDTNPGVNTTTGLGYINIPSLLESGYQNSLNLGFAYLSNPLAVFGGVTKPTFPSFDPNARGQYSFSLVAYRKAGFFGTTYGAQVGEGTSMVVNTVPEPATLAMFSILTIGAAGAYRRRKKLVATC